MACVAQTIRSICSMTYMEATPFYLQPRFMSSIVENRRYLLPYGQSARLSVGKSTAADRRR